MKTKILLLVLILFGLSVTIVSATATPRTVKEWEKCRDKAEASVDFHEQGNAGIESAIQKQCGEPPVNESGTVRGIGIHPYDLVRSKTWKKKFTNITKKEYEIFTHRLSVAGITRLEEEWLVGEGNAPHSGGDSEAAFAINVASGEVFVAMLEDGNKISGFGFGTSWENAPKFLQTWAKKRKKDAQTESNISSKPEANNIMQKIKSRCQTQMGEYGAAMVKACVDQDIEAAQALNAYLKNHEAIVSRCLGQMGEYGYAMVKACAEQDIEAENALRKY
jgi:hypothetical protein